MTALALLTGGCGADRSPASDAMDRDGLHGALVVSAASSLGDVLEEGASAFERLHPGVDVDLHLAGSAQLVTQLGQGVPADVLVTADDATYRRAAEAGLVGDPTVIATNRLAIIVERGNPEGITGLADLGREELVVVACAPAVPCGSYADRALDAADVRVPIRSREDNVKAVVAKVALGEADAGIAYATDVLASDGRVEGIPLDDGGRDDLVVRYPAGVVADAEHGPAARAFVDFLTAPEAQGILTRFGFVAVGRS